MQGPGLEGPSLRAGHPSVPAAREEEDQPLALRWGRESRQGSGARPAEFQKAEASSPTPSQAPSSQELLPHSSPWVGRGWGLGAFLVEIRGGPEGSLRQPPAGPR